MRAAIVDHRNTWITEDDFEIMSSAGINAVRVPVGYWVLATSQVRALGHHFRCILSAVARRWAPPPRSADGIGCEA